MRVPLADKPREFWFATILVVIVGALVLWAAFALAGLAYVALTSWLFNS